MAVYHGVVKGNVIVLAEDAQLEEGTEVEVRPLSLVGESGREAGEEAFKESLREAGLVLNFPELSQLALEDDFEPIKVEGQPISQMIIEERR